MNELREIFDAGKPNVISERKRPDGDSKTVVVPFVQAGEKNGNGRTYPLALLQREVARIQDAVKKHSMIGTGDHPISGSANVATASHILQKVWLDEKGKGFVQMKIVPTPRGKAIMTLIDQGAELGVSSRGFGTTSPTGIVRNDYRLVGIDIVTSPSYKEGVFSKKDIFESLEFESDEDSVIQKKVTPAEVYYEATVMGVDPKTYAEMLNKNSGLQEESDSDLSPREIRFALEEARQSGIDTSDASERKKALEIFRQQKTQKVLTEDERAEAVAEEFGTTPEHVKKIWAMEHKKKAEEQKKTGRINLLIKEGIASGFGSETRPESRRISKKIIEGE